MDITLKHSIDRIIKDDDQGTLTPYGTILIEFKDSGVFCITGDLINVFDVLLSESFRVVLGSVRSGTLSSSVAATVITLIITQEKLLEITVFDGATQLNEGKSDLSILVDPIEWLSLIAVEFRLFQETSEVSKETVLRHKRAVTTSLLEALF